MLAVLDSNTEMNTIYIRLLNEGIDVWRPAEARLLNERDHIYEIAPLSDYHSLDEEWQFLPGSRVRCGYETHNGESILVAQEPA